MEKITLKTLEDFKAFCSNEKEKENVFASENDAAVFRGYKYFENHLGSCSFNYLSSLIEDEEYLSFPLEIEIIENPIVVEKVGFFSEFFDDPKKAVDYANRCYNIDGFRGIEILGRGLSYEYDRDFCLTALSDNNQDTIAEMLSLIDRDESI